jgi:hypothetical protein
MAAVKWPERIGVMTYAFAHIGAVVGMRVEDYYPGGERHEVPAL